MPSNRVIGPGGFGEALAFQPPNLAMTQAAKAREKGGSGLNIQSLRFEGSKNLFNDPSPAIKLNNF